jgi:hypothetical protein
MPGVDAVLQQQGLHGQLHRDERSDSLEVLPGLLRLHDRRLLGDDRLSPEDPTSGPTIPPPSGIAG